MIWHISKISISKANPPSWKTCYRKNVVKHVFAKDFFFLNGEELYKIEKEKVVPTEKNRTWRGVTLNKMLWVRSGG